MKGRSDELAFTQHGTLEYRGASNAGKHRGIYRDYTNIDDARMDEYN